MDGVLTSRVGDYSVLLAPREPHQNLIFFWSGPSGEDNDKQAHGAQNKLHDFWRCIVDESRLIVHLAQLLRVETPPE